MPHEVGPGTAGSRVSALSGTVALGREIAGLATAAAGLRRALGRREPGVVRAPSGAVSAGAGIAGPVLLVHGYLGTDAPWAPLVDRLHLAGVADVFTMTYDSLSAGVPGLGAALSAAVGTVLSATGETRVHLVGYSLGGVVVRYAVQLLGLDTLTRSVVTIATPHRGSPLAWLAPGPAAAHLRPGSAVLRGLPPIDRTGPVPWTDIHAAADVVVPGRWRGEGVRVAGHGHNSILRSPELADAVLAHLLAAGLSTVR
ncbi:MAG TPA: hypothetical protein VGD72_07450 [Mycobacteriales bacterium]|jgi:pimeloyl-ACP methyl ester carboxylesterase